MITARVVDEAIAWNTKYHKPVLMSEYGADTVEGLHFVSISLTCRCLIEIIEKINIVFLASGIRLV